MSEKHPRAVAASAEGSELDGHNTDPPPPAEDSVETEGPITPRAPPPPSNPQAGAAARRRPKVGVRIPDDNVARPSSGRTPEPAPIGHDSIRPSPIIQINAPPRSSTPPRPAPKEEELVAGAPTLVRGPSRSPSERPAPTAPDTEVAMPRHTSDSEPPVDFDDGGESPTPIAGIPRKIPSSRPPHDSFDSEDIPVDEDMPPSSGEDVVVEAPPNAVAVPAAAAPTPSKVPIKQLRVASAVPPGQIISPVATTIMTPLAASPPSPAAITPVSVPVVPSAHKPGPSAKGLDVPPPPPPRTSLHAPPPPPGSLAGPARRISAPPPPPPPIGFSSTPNLPDPPSPQGGVPAGRPLVVLSPNGGGASGGGGLAPPPMNEAAAARKKARPWWEELFNDDFIRTMAKITDAQIAREADFIEDSLGVAKAAMVLDLGCGTGRHAIELTRRGYQVAGFDLSLAMLARAADEAQERNQKLNFLQGDMREMTFEDTFDGVYCWNTSFGFFEEEKNAHVVHLVHRSLRKGGQFLLDVVNRDYMMREQPSLAWFEGDGCICMDEMSIDWITSRMRVKRTMMMDDGRSKEIEYSIRVYSLHELGKILHDQGFRVAEVSGRVGSPGVFFGAESPRTLILAEKR